MEAAIPTRNVFQDEWGGEGCREHRHQSRDRTIHQSDQSGLYDLQDEAPLGIIGLLYASFGRRRILVDLVGRFLVRSFGDGEIAENLADRRVERSAGNLVIEAAGVRLHPARLLTHRLGSEWPDESGWPLLRNAPHIVRPDRGDRLTKVRLEQIDEPMTVLGLLLRHVREHTGTVRVGMPQLVRELAIRLCRVLLVAMARARTSGSARSWIWRLRRPHRVVA